MSFNYLIFFVLHSYIKPDLVSVNIESKEISINARKQNDYTIPDVEYSKNCLFSYGVCRAYFCFLAN